MTKVHASVSATPPLVQLCNVRTAVTVSSKDSEVTCAMCLRILRAHGRSILKEPHAHR